MSSQARFPDRLTAIMFDKRLSTSALSQMANIPERTIARYRAGVSVPVDRFGDPTPNAHALADVLGVDVEFLLDSPRELAS